MVDKSTDHWKVVVDLFLYNNLDGFEVVVFRKNARAGKKIQIAPPSRHFHGLYSY